MQGHRYGCHRVLEPQGVLPQPAWRLDSSPTLYDNEIHIEIDRLNIDSASFYQLHTEAQGETEQIKQKILSIVQDRGKMHNPVTGSGGMLVGRVKQIGKQYPNTDLQIGDAVASLVSLTLTPLHLEEIIEIHPATGQVSCKGTAILFESAPLTKLPQDLPEALSLAVLDVCGAPAQVNRLVKEGDTVLLLGAAGKSGLLSTYMAKKRVGASGRVIAMDYEQHACQRLKDWGVPDMVLQGNAQDTVAVLAQVEEATNGRLADVVINCVNVPHTEMTSILCTKDDGLTYFFSTATSFTAAALGAEGVGKDVQLMMGNGYAVGHAALSLDIIRESAYLKDYFTKVYT